MQLYVWEARGYSINKQTGKNNSDSGIDEMGFKSKFKVTEVETSLLIITDLLR